MNTTLRRLALGLAISLSGLGLVTTPTAESPNSSETTTSEKAVAPEWLGPLGINVVQEKDGLRVREVAKDSAAWGLVASGELLLSFDGRPLKQDGTKTLLKRLLGVLAAAEPTLKMRVVNANAEAREVALTWPKPWKLPASFPFYSEDSDASLLAALDWLVSAQRKDGNWPAGLGWRPGGIVVTAVSLLALLDGGRPEDRAAILKARAWLEEHTKASQPVEVDPPAPEVNWNQENWGLAWSLLALAELQIHRPAAASAKHLQRIADLIVANQAQNGGWAHGPGGPNALGYTEFTAITTLCVTALVLAKRAGAKVATEVLRNAKGYLMPAISKRGLLGYSHEKTGEMGYGEAGRTAMLAPVAQALELPKNVRDLMQRRLAADIGAEVSKTWESHASKQMALVFAAWWSAPQGRGPFIAFAKPLRAHFALATLKDGRIAANSNREIVKVGRNTDQELGFPWITATWLLALNARHQRLSLNGGTPHEWPEEATAPAKDGEAAKDGH